MFSVPAVGLVADVNPAGVAFSVALLVDELVELAEGFDEPAELQVLFPIGRSRVLARDEGLNRRRVVQSEINLS